MKVDCLILISFQFLYINITMMSYVQVSTSSSLGQSHHGLNKALDRHFDQPRVLSRVPVSDLGFRSTEIMGTSLLPAFCTSMRQAETHHVHGIIGRQKCSLIPRLFFSLPTQSLGMRVLAFIDLAYEKHLAYLKLNHEHLLTVISFLLPPLHWVATWMQSRHAVPTSSAMWQQLWSLTRGGRVCSRTSSESSDRYSLIPISHSSGYDLNPLQWCIIYTCVQHFRQALGGEKLNLHGSS